MLEHYFCLRKEIKMDNSKLTNKAIPPIPTPHSSSPLSLTHVTKGENYSVISKNKYHPFDLVPLCNTRVAHHYI